MCQACLYVSLHKNDHVAIGVIEVANIIDTKSTKRAIKTDLLSIKMCLLNQTDSGNIMFTSSEREFMSPVLHLRRSI